MTVQKRLASELVGMYRVTRELGAGGMATVYLAHDLKHDRDVAIKVLHPDLGAALGAERFLSEIKTTAKLQHPHILPLLDSGAADGLLYYVMPFVRGETLRARLERERQLPIADALRIAREVASALEHAHKQGIIHRDIKPENILLQDGAAVVADFGIALAVQSAGGARMTQTGLSLGTPQYMSPEQAMGERTIDARSDIYALGAVTYEMLAGEPPFTASSAQAIVAKVLTERPTPLRTVRDTIAESVDSAVLQALAKLPADRFASAAMFADALHANVTRDSSSAAQSNAKPVVPRARTASIVRTAALIAMSAALAIAGTRYVERGSAQTASTSVLRFDIAPPPGGAIAYQYGNLLAHVAISPDASQLVVTSWMPGAGAGLGIRHADELQMRIIPRTAAARDPAFSPDGKWIAFSTPSTVEKIAPDGTALTTIYSLEPNESAIDGLTWLSNGELILSIENNEGTRRLVRIAAGGGAPRPLSTGKLPEGQVMPWATPDGRFVFFTSSAISMTGSVRIGVLRISDGKTVVSSLPGSRALGMIGGRLVYVRPDGTIQSAPFDETTLQLGAPVRIGDGVAVRFSNASVALSTSGTLIYQNASLTTQLVRVSENGSVATLLDSARGYRYPRLSPDGRVLALEIDEPGSVDIWTLDLAAHTVLRATEDGTSDRPEWRPDGEQLVYLSSRDGERAIWGQPFNGQGAATVLHRTPSATREVVFTPDGKSLVYRVDSTNLNRDIWLVPLSGDRRPVPLLARSADDLVPRVSPDGRWLAFQSSESGRYEVYVRALSGDAGRIAVSSEGATEPLWSRDGRRLFYRSAGKLMAAEIGTTPTLTVRARRELFTDVFAQDDFHPNYDVLPDGRSFIMLRPTRAERQIQVIVNWATEVRRRLNTE